MTRRRRALVTNDDGIAAEGLVRLAAAAEAAGLEVVVAAPEDNLSGASASLTAVRADGRVVVERHRLAGCEAIEAYAVAATPAFIALLATRGAFGPPPEVVLSGINYGHNAGQAVLHSGTVGAAFTAAAAGCRAMAFSLVPGEPAQWATAVEVARAALGSLLEHEAGAVVNVNVPDVAPGALRGLRQARLSRFGAVQANVAETGEGYVTVELVGIEPDEDPDTDAALLADGWATLSFLRPLCELHGPRPDALLRPPPPGSPCGADAGTL